MSNFALGRASMRNLDRVDSRMVGIMITAIKLTRVDFGIPSTGGYRTVEQQRELFNTGASLCDGMSKRSRHQSGLAVDVFAYVNGKASYKNIDLESVTNAILQAALIHGHKISWGGLWTKFRDMPHFELLE